MHVVIISPFPPFLPPSLLSFHCGFLLFLHAVFQSLLYFLSMSLSHFMSLSSLFYRYQLPGVSGLNFVLHIVHKSLAGGGVSSLGSDPQV